MLELIEAQTKKVDQRLDALLLVGGFSGSEYLFHKVKVRGPPAGLCGSSPSAILSLTRHHEFAVFRRLLAPESQSLLVRQTVTRPPCAARRSTALPADRWYPV